MIDNYILDGCALRPVAGKLEVMSQKGEKYHRHYFDAAKHSWEWILSSGVKIFRVSQVPEPDDKAISFYDFPDPIRVKFTRNR